MGTTSLSYGIRPGRWLLFNTAVKCTEYHIVSKSEGEYK